MHCFTIACKTAQMSNVQFLLSLQKYFQYQQEYSVKTWLDGGLEKKKLILGFPLYGQSFTLADANNNSLNAPTYGGAEAGTYTRQRGFLSYYEVNKK